MVAVLLQERQGSYRSLEGWAGPHRFEDLPVAKLLAKEGEKDPRGGRGVAGRICRAGLMLPLRRGLVGPATTSQS